MWSCISVRLGRLVRRIGIKQGICLVREDHHVAMRRLYELLPDGVIRETDLYMFRPRAGAGAAKDTDAL
jgi:hypothetical protein